MAASSSAVAVDPSLHKYDLFISFRGETRNSFTSHLYFALCQKHIKAYIDEVSLEKGDDIERALPLAIKQSAISIIVFSENYASSRWCLDELVDILKCKKEQDQIVLTIFYGIDPSHIRHQKGTYAAAFDKHQERFEDKIVQEWRQALTRAADLSGWDSRDKSESVLVQQVVEVVIRKLESISSTSIDDQKGLIGMDRQLCNIESLLCFDSQNVRILGIWGMGGIGKTTLARVVFQRFSNRFERTCFLESVREESQRKGLVKLEKEVFSKLLGEKDPDVKNSFVKVRLSRTKALLVLDDVDHFEQLRRLAGDRDLFGPGSKIIVTSRDLQVLKQLIDVTYKVPELDLKNEASQLFYLKAFKENSCRTGFEEISRRVVGYTKGHPLALQVLGAFFCSLEGIEEWEEELEKLKRIPKDEIQVVLKRSYDALDDEEKGLFLDIACFFKWRRRDFVERILEGKPIRGLVNKSLITIEDGRIHMHDLIQEMGRDIVLRSTQRSRLWIGKDVSDVLENKKGTEAIEGICLSGMKEKLYLRPDVFEEMSKLRLLEIPPYNVYIDGDLKYLPNSLRYLDWEGYPGKSLPSNFKAQNLVELHMPNSKLEQLWDGVQELGSLKRINLHNSELLTKIPDLSRAPKLENINLSDCGSLIHIPSLNLNLQATGVERTARCINLDRCWRLTTLPKVSGNIEELLLDSLGIEQIPSSSIEGLCSLRKLSLSYCRSLSSLQFNINLKALKELNIIVTPIQELPSTIEMIYNLEYLYISGCKKLQSLPASIGMLYKLKKLYIGYCENLQSLPELPLFIETVNAINCSSLEMVSRSTLTLGRWLDKYDSHNYCPRREFSFLYCTELGEDAINNIFREFLYKVFCTASTPPQVIHAEEQRAIGDRLPSVVQEQRAIGELVVCYPTKEIPRWFKNQYEGSSITITLPPNWYNPKTFLGFVISVVVGWDDADGDPDGEGDGWHEDFFDFDECDVVCELHLLTNKDRFRVGVFNYQVRIWFDHIVMWYNYFDRSKANFENYQKASLEVRSQYGRVKRCGVRMLYLKDTVEESDDGSTANFESRRTGVIDADKDYATTYDSDEPSPQENLEFIASSPCGKDI